MPITQTDSLLMDVVKRLETVIVVLIETARPNGKPLPVKDKVRILSSAGLRPTEIASLLRITPQNVSVVLYELRKKKPSKPKPKLLQVSAHPTSESTPQDTGVNTAGPTT